MSGLWPEQYGHFYCETCDWFHGIDDPCEPCSACGVVHGVEKCPRPRSDPRRTPIKGEIESSS